MALAHSSRGCFDFSGGCRGLDWQLWVCMGLEVVLEISNLGIAMISKTEAIGKVVKHKTRRTMAGSMVRKEVVSSNERDYI